MKNTKQSASTTVNLNDPKALASALQAHFKTTEPEAFLYAYTKSLETHYERSALAKSVEIKGHEHRTVTVTLPDGILQRLDAISPSPKHYALFISDAIDKGLTALALES